VPNVIMPQLGETVTEGTVGKWLKKVGEQVAKYEPLLDVETDKVASEIPSPYAGTVTKILAEEGATVPVGAPICEIEETGKKAEGPAQAVPGPAQAPAGPVAPAQQQSRGDGVQGDDGARYSPAVRKLAREHRIDLRGVTGTGRGGRVTAQDVATASKTPSASPPRLAAPSAPLSPAPPTPTAVPPQQAHAVPVAPPSGEDSIVKLTPIRKTIADRMAQSRFTIPFAWSLVEVDVTELAKWRDKEKAGFKAREGVSLTFVPIVVSAVAAALRQVPLVNSAWAGDHIIQRRRVNVGIAIDTDDGLIVPVVRDADRLSLSGLATTLAELIDKARRRKLTMEELSDGTITVNNTGAIGSVISVPIINPPQAAIFAMEATVKRPWVVNDAIAIRSIMNVSLCFDHRVFDGGTASKFLQSVKRRLEGPPPAL